MITKRVLAVFLVLGIASAAAAEQDTRVFELRTYYSPPGKLDDLHARFRDHTMKLFEKNGLTNIGYWVPIDNSENKLIYMLIYMLSHQSVESRKATFDAFLKDPAWKEAAANSVKEAGGPLTVPGGVTSVMLKATDYSPMR